MNPKKSLRAGINLTIVVAWFVIFIIQIYCIGLLYNQIISDEKEKASENILLAQDFIQRKIDTSRIIQETVVNNNNVMKSLLNPQNELHKDLKNSISELMQDNRGIIYEPLHIIFLDKNNNASSMTGEIPGEVMKKAVDFFKTDNNNELNFFTATAPLFNAVYFCTSQQITFPSTHKVETEYIGTFIVVGQVNIAELIRLSSMSNASYAYLTNDAGERIDLVAPSEHKGSNFNSNQKISDSGWQLCISMPITFPIPPIFMMFLLEIVLLPLIFLSLQILISHNLYKPIAKIYGFLNDYPKKLNRSRLNLKTQTELGIIADKINNMLEDTENLYRRIITTQQTLYETELIQRSTTLYALQAQLVPHFIYNTLDCICGLANTFGVPQIADIVVSLSKILRYSITEEKEVLFIQELEVLEYYITIQSIMFPDRFDVEFDISDETHSVHCLKMIVQPVVENAFKHAFRDPGRKYLLNISAYVDEKFLVVKIRDNGCGITDENLKRIQEELSSVNETLFVEKQDTTHIGISNIQYRIFLNYGKDYKINIDSKENEYTEVTLHLPNKNQ